MYGSCVANFDAPESDLDLSVDGYFAKSLEYIDMVRSHARAIILCTAARQALPATTNSLLDVCLVPARMRGAHSQGTVPWVTRALIAARCSKGVDRRTARARRCRGRAGGAARLRGARVCGARAGGALRRAQDGRRLRHLHWQPRRRLQVACTPRALARRSPLPRPRSNGALLRALVLVASAAQGASRAGQD